MSHPIERWRRYHEVTQRVLAQTAGVGRSMVSYIESGSRGMSISVLVRLIIAMDVLKPGESLTAGQLLGLEPYEPPDNGGDGGS